MRPSWVVRENKWRAARYGLDAEIILDDHGRTRPLKQDLSDLVEHLAPIADELGCGEELRSINSLAAKGGSYQRQLKIVAEGGDLRDVVSSLTRELTGGPGA